MILPELAAAFAVILAVAVVASVTFAIYNAVIALDQRIDKAWANVEVALKQRWDQLPNLVAAVRDVMAFERETLTEVARLRAAYAPGEPIPAQAVTSDATSVALRRLFAVVENYPQLRSATNVLDLQDEIERLEGVIADRRELYNDQVYRYNARIGQLPGVLLAPIFSWRPRPYFRADPSETGRPTALLATTR